jgi:hypothetical protein
LVGPNDKGERCPVFIEKYWPMLTKDIDEATDALSQTLPDTIRQGLEGELKKLQALYAVLSGVEEKSTLHQLRAKLRWATVRLEKERDPAKQKKMEHEIQDIKAEIKREVERRERK